MFIYRDSISYCTIGYVHACISRQQQFMRTKIIIIYLIDLNIRIWTLVFGRFGDQFDRISCQCFTHHKCAFCRFTFELHFRQQHISSQLHSRFLHQWPLIHYNNNRGNIDANQLRQYVLIGEWETKKKRGKNDWRERSWKKNKKNIQQPIVPMHTMCLVDNNWHVGTRQL